MKVSIKTNEKRFASSENYYLSEKPSLMCDIQLKSNRKDEPVFFSTKNFIQLIFSKNAIKSVWLFSSVRFSVSIDL